MPKLLKIFTAKNRLLERYLGIYIISILKTILLFALSSAIIVTLLYFANFSWRSIGLSGSPADWGVIGDYLGGLLNPIFSFLALMALLMTIIIQSKELKLSRDELEETRKEVTGSKLALEAQAESIRIQTFENTFFKMITLHHQIVDDISIETRTRSAGETRENLFEGQDALLKILRITQDKLIDRGAKAPNVNELSKVWEEVYSDLGYKMSHYFRNLYRIFKLIDENKLEKPKLYSGIIRAQLSDVELTLIFINCLHPIGKNFKPLVEKYSILENINPTLLARYENILNKYRKSAYGDRLEIFEEMFPVMRS